MSDLIHTRTWNHHSFSFTLSGFNTIQKRYEYFLFLSLISYSQLSVSNWEDGVRERVWPSPLLFLHLSFGLLVLAYVLFLSPSQRLAADDNSFQNAQGFIPSFSVFLFMGEQKNIKRSQFVHFVGILMRGTVLSQAFCDRI